jgi:hypothetical protein
MKRKTCDPCHENKVKKNVQYYLATGQESERQKTLQHRL